MQEENYATIFSALGNSRRLQIVQWLSNPIAHFPTQRDGDLVIDGVCSGAIVTKLGVSQPSVAVHMKVLESTGIVQSKRIKQWTFYQLNIDALNDAKNLIGELMSAAASHEKRSED